MWVVGVSQKNSTWDGKEGSIVATKAYVLIETAVGKTKDVLRSLQQVTGEYDIVAVVEAENLNSIGELVTGNIHTIGGIQRTTTYLSVSVE